MGKTLTREQRKGNKYISRISDREQKYQDYFPVQDKPIKKDRSKKKWRPHSEIEID